MRADQPVRDEIPIYRTLLRPVLEAVAAAEAIEIPAITLAVANRLNLSEEARAARLPNGRTVLDNRVRWATTMLAKAGLAERPRELTLAATQAGRELLRTFAGEIDPDYLAQTRPAFAHWLADMGQRLEERRDPSDPATVWMVRAGRGGMYAPQFVELRSAIVGWGLTGSVDGLSRDELMDVVSRAYPDMRRNVRGQAVSALDRIAHQMTEGDLVITPEPASRTVLLGWITGPYTFLDEPVAEDMQHSRGVRWFARVSRDELSYGARNTTGTLLTLTRPSHETELLRLAEAHAEDDAPQPQAQRTRRSARPAAVAQHVAIPANAAVAQRGAIAEFHPISRRLTHLLDELHNGHLALPDFQRSFVWAPDATRELLVSIIRSFPAGALLFLQGGGVAFKARAAEEAPDLVVEPSHLVLDGQQRLTSLYQALFGLGTSRFFVDIGALISGADVNDAVRVFNADRAAPLASLQAQADALMMPLATVRDGRASQWRDEVVELRKDDDSNSTRALLRDVERTYIQPLVEYAFPVTVLPAATELEAVCTIFETLNRTGKPLTPFELISARAFAGGLSLHDHWLKARAEHPILEDFGVEPYYLLQVIALRLGVSCKRSSVLALSAVDIDGHWPSVVDDMAQVLAVLRDECGVLTDRWLPYRPMLIPLAAVWSDVAGATGPAQGGMRTKLKQWFWCACFTGEYESSSATLAERDTPLLKHWLAGGDPPAVVSEFAWRPDRWRTVTIRQKGLYSATIALMLTDHPKDFHSAAPLTRDVIDANKVDDHHVFPRAYLREIGRAQEVDSVLNHCLIDRATNIRIGKRPPSEYLAEMRAELGPTLDQVLRSQRLPTGEHSPLRTDRFDSFLEWRSTELHSALKMVAGGMNQPPVALDPTRARLDALIEDVELRLRNLILVRVEDASALPSHVAQKAIDRMKAAHRRNPGASPEADGALAHLLEYFDIRELQDTFCAKTLWADFEPVFGTKEALTSRFNQLAELRNAIRHSRTIHEVAIKDGEAAILWFSKALTSTS